MELSIAAGNEGQPFLYLCFEIDDKGNGGAIIPEEKEKEKIEIQVLDNSSKSLAVDAERALRSDNWTNAGTYTHAIERLDATAPEEAWRGIWSNPRDIEAIERSKRANSETTQSIDAPSNAWNYNLENLAQQLQALALEMAPAHEKPPPRRPAPAPVPPPHPPSSPPP